MYVYINMYVYYIYMDVYIYTNIKCMYDCMICKNHFEPGFTGSEALSVAIQYCGLLTLRVQVPHIIGLWGPFLGTESQK